MSQFKFLHSPIREGNGQRVAVWQEDAQLTTRQFYTVLAENADLRAAMTRWLLDCPFQAVFWETPSVTKATVDTLFEFVVIEGLSLTRVTPNPIPFRAKFAASCKQVISFANLGGDAVLVVPCPISGNENYAHLTVFLQSAPAGQSDLFWQEVSKAFWARLSDKPVWVSTAGMGVSWLHVRLDNRPKYYRHQAYRGDFGRKSERRY